MKTSLVAGQVRVVPCQTSWMKLSAAIFAKSSLTEAWQGLNTPPHGTWDHSFSAFAKFSEKLIFLTPSYAYVRVRIRGRNVSFPENFTNVLNE